MAASAELTQEDVGASRVRINRVASVAAGFVYGTYR